MGGNCPARRAIFLAGLLMSLAWTAPAGAETRLALVIGNSDYKQIPALSNPASDAALMARTLSKVGFEVAHMTNADRRGMARAIRDFGRKLRSAGPNAVGLFYYAGHGVQAGRINYLIPLNAPVETEVDLEIEAVSAQWILSQMEYAGNGLNIVILDACRNNPFRGTFRSGARGLARMSAPRGSILAYAAGPGEVAADGSSGNSPYTRALADAMEEPGLDIVKVFQSVRIAVEEATDGVQTPWEESSLRGDFYFVPLKKEHVAVLPPATLPVTTPSPALANSPRLEALFWETIKDSDDPAVFNAYLEKFPDGVFAALAKLRLEELSDTVPEGELDAPSRQAPVPEEPPSFEVQALSATLYAQKTSNVRAGPGTEFEKVGRLSPGDEVSVTGKVADKDWYRVVLAEDADGYVYVPLLSDRKPSDTQWAATELAAAIGGEIGIDRNVLQALLNQPAFRSAPPVRASYEKIRYRDGETSETFFRDLGGGWVTSRTKGGSWYKQEILALNGLIEIASLTQINDRRTESIVTAVSDINGKLFPIKTGNIMRVRLAASTSDGVRSTRYYEIQVTRRIIGRTVGLPVDGMVYEIYVTIENTDHVEINGSVRDRKSRPIALYRYYIPDLGIIIAGGRVVSKISVLR